jgi:high frequency lysogenization protein
MIEQQPDYRSLALAGVFQCADLVRSCATGLPVSEAARRAVITAITTHNVSSLSEIFPEPAALGQGIDAAVATLGGENDRGDVLRYALQLIDLARRLKQAPVVIERLSGGLDRLDGHPEDPALAGLYQETISTLGKRIQVAGDSEVLQQPGVADKIRALLLAGVRFSWLWQQLGGGRWQLILNRKQALVSLQSLQSMRSPDVLQSPDKE